MKLIVEKFRRYRTASGRDRVDSTDAKTPVPVCFFGYLGLRSDPVVTAPGSVPIIEAVNRDLCNANERKPNKLLSRS